MTTAWSHLAPTAILWAMKRLVEALEITEPVTWAVLGAVQLPRRGADPRQLPQGYSWLWEAAAASPTLWRSLDISAGA